LKVARQGPERVWAVEGANGIGRPIAQRLLADGERVLDVPARLPAQARVFDTGQRRKTDATDAPGDRDGRVEGQGLTRGQSRPGAGVAVPVV
jgi:transposase